MKQFLLLFRNASGDHGYHASSEDMARDLPLWQSWIGNIAQQGKLVSTAPIAYESSRVFQTGVHDGPHKEAENVLVSGYLICNAENIEEVQAWSKDCPILKYNHSSVEIRPLVPFPLN